MSYTVELISFPRSAWECSPDAPRPLCKNKIFALRKTFPRGALERDHQLCNY